MHHAIDTGEGGAATLAAMRIELFLGENITTCLGRLLAVIQAQGIDLRQQIGLTSQEKETIVDTKDHLIRWVNKRLKRVFQGGVVSLERVCQ
jgi:hypothetical protein